MNEKLFTGLSDLAEGDDQMSEIESYCVNCGQNGMTRILLTEIPFFRQVVIMSFSCPHCHHHNNELQPAQEIAERGVRLSVNCLSPKVLNCLNS
jgi:zinc finger protein